MCIFIYRLRLCRRPLFLHIRLYLIWVLGWFGMRHWIRGAILLRIAYLKSHFSWFWGFSVFDILLIVFRLVSIVFWYLFNVSAIFWGHQKDARRKTMQYGCGISSRSALGTRFVTKTMPRIAYCPELIAIGGLGHPGKLFSLIFIGFHWFQEDLKLSGARRLASLWRPVGPCGGFVLALLECCNQKAALCSIGRLQSAGWEIARYCSNGWLESAG